jgi:hypothetical protein
MDQNANCVIQLSDDYASWRCYQCYAPHVLAPYLNPVWSVLKSGRPSEVFCDWCPSTRAMDVFESSGGEGVRTVQWNESYRAYHTMQPLVLWICCHEHNAVLNCIDTLLLAGATFSGRLQQFYSCSAWDAVVPRCYFAESEASIISCACFRTK